MAKDFPDDFSDRGTVKSTDKLLIHNIDTGVTEYTTVGALASVLAGLANPEFTTGITTALGANGTVATPVKTVAVKPKTTGAYPSMKWGNSFNDDSHAWIEFFVRNAGGAETFIERIDDDGVYVIGTVSADGFTDRTPYYEGDALTEISSIKGIDGQIDHDSLPEFVKRQKVIGTGTIIHERDLGAMISVLTVAVQQLTTKNIALEARIKKLESTK